MNCERCHSPKARRKKFPTWSGSRRLQAFTAVGDDWPLDYVELGEQGGAVNVLAAVLSPKQVDQMRQVCAASELTPRCLVLRPFAAASLLHRAGVLTDGKSALIIDMLADGADLTAVGDGQVTFMRTVRLPATSDEAVQVRALLGEVRRTIAAVQAQEGGERIERIVICGRCRRTSRCWCSRSRNRCNWKSFRSIRSRRCRSRRACSAKRWPTRDATRRYWACWRIMQQVPGMPSISSIRGSVRRHPANAEETFDHAGGGRPVSSARLWGSMPVWFTRTIRSRTFGSRSPISTKEWTGLKL